MRRRRTRRPLLRASLKLREPRHDITVFERSAPGEARGWAVSLWDDLLEKLYRTDPESAREIEQASFVWDKMVVDVRGEQLVHAGGRGYGMGRQRLLEILARRALAAGVHIEFEHEVTAASQLPECDLIVACDGVNSRIRNETNGFQTDVRLGSNKYIWLGTDKIFEIFTRHFVHTDSGWLWSGTHAYGANSSAKWSSFTIECQAETWAGLGFDTMPHEECLALLEKIFERSLDGHQLIGQTSGETNAQWLSFRTVTNKHWHDGKIVLAGDAAHTAHFSIGSGTKLAIEDAIALADNLQRHGEVKPLLRPTRGNARPRSWGLRSRLASAINGMRTLIATSALNRTSSPRLCTDGGHRCFRIFPRGSATGSTPRPVKSRSLAG